MKFDQPFRPLLEDFGRFNSIQELEGSLLYQKTKPDIDRILNKVWCEDFAPPAAREDLHRVVAWNIERGMRLNGILHFLRVHPLLKNADVLLLSELD